MSFALYGSPSQEQATLILYHIHGDLSRGFRKKMCRQNDEKRESKLCKVPGHRNTGRAGATDSCTTRRSFIFRRTLYLYYIILLGFCQGVLQKFFKKVFHRLCGKTCGKLVVNDWDCIRHSRQPLPQPLLLLLHH